MGLWSWWDLDEVLDLSWCSNGLRLQGILEEWIYFACEMDINLWGPEGKLCSSLNNDSPKMPYLVPGTGEYVDFADVNKLRSWIRDIILDYPGGPNVRGRLIESGWEEGTWWQKQRLEWFALNMDTNRECRWTQETVSVTETHSLLEPV